MLLRLKQNMPTESTVLCHKYIIADYFRDAYHPILYLNNKQKKEITHPQTIELQQENRIIVISDQMPVVNNFKTVDCYN
jgi:hypothetical protein